MNKQLTKGYLSKLELMSNPLSLVPCPLSLSEKEREPEFYKGL